MVDGTAVVKVKAKEAIEYTGKIKLDAHATSEETSEVKSYTAEFKVTAVNEHPVVDPTVVCTEAHIDGTTLSNPIASGETLTKDLKDEDYLNLKLDNYVGSDPT